VKLVVKSMTNSDGDHLWLEDTSIDEYIDNSMCCGCGSEMKAISIIQNTTEQVGLVNGLCPQCGYIKKIRNLSVDTYTSHFSNKWLVRREEEVVGNKHVYDRLRPYISESGTVLDIGCGLGGSLLPFYNLDYDVYGVEPSKHRSEKAKAIMSNIETGTAEDYLDSSERYFDVIYIYNVLQFVENPFKIIEMAAKRLKDDGVLYIRVGAFGHKSNYSQSSHQGIIRNNLSLYALKSLIGKLNLFPIFSKNEPFELILSRKKSSKSNQILSSAMKIDERTVKKYVKRTLKLNWLRVFGKVKLSYSGRRTELIFKRSEGKELPVIFEHNSLAIPIVLK